MSDCEAILAPPKAAHKPAVAAGLARLRRAFGVLAVHRSWACVAVFAFTLSARLALLPWMPVPLPAVHDEFSYLLAADTFASGRIANPPHRFWEHFESYHVLQQPVYASKYPPLQGLTLAAGQLVGSPWIGVWVSCGVMSAAMTWMLQAWLPPRCALLVALLAAWKIGVLGYWMMNSYWGGALATLGGCLVLGAVPRLRTRLSAGAALVFAGGTLILWNTRPFEGSLVVVSAACAVGWRWRGDLRQLLRTAWPAMPLLLAGIAGMGFYNWRVTGSPLLMPYVLHERQYSVTSPFLWQPIRPAPVYRHAIMRKFWQTWEVGIFRVARERPFLSTGFKIYLLWEFFVGYLPLLAVFIAGFRCWRLARVRSVLALGAGLSIGLLLERFVLPHYAAPGAGLIYALFGYGLFAVRAWRPGGQRYGPVLAFALLTAFAADSVAALVTSKPAPGFGEARAELVARLEREPGRQLVLVRYGPQHNIHDEWVYNRADIDRSRIVWAREMSRGQDEPMIRYFAGRKVWLFAPDSPEPRLTPYPGPG